MAVAAGGPGRRGAGHPRDDLTVALTTPVYDPAPIYNPVPVYNLANLLTAARLVAALPVVLLIQAEAWPLAFAVFVLAALTDVADGWVAKRFAGRSSVGAMLDPMADKLLIAGTCIALAHAAVFPVWLVAMVIGRDVLIVLGTAFVRARSAGYQVVPLAVGKATTFVQLVTVAVVLAGLAGVAEVRSTLDLLVPLTTALLIVSGIAYLTAAFRAVLPGSVRT